MSRLVAGFATFSLLLIAGSIGYYFTWVLPHQNQAKLEWEKERSAKELKLKQDQLEEQKRKNQQDCRLKGGGTPGHLFDCGL